MFKLFVVDKQEKYIGARERVLRGCQTDVKVRQLVGQRMNIWFDSEKSTLERCVQSLHYLYCGAFSQIVDIRFEGEAEAGDDDILLRFLGVFFQKLRDSRLDLPYHPLRFVVVYFSGRADKSGFFRCLTDDEPRINGDAVPSHSRAGLEDVYARVSVGEADQFPYVDSLLVADDGEFVGEGDIDVAEAVLGEFAHLGGPRICKYALAFDEDSIELCRNLRTSRCDAPDNAIIVHQLVQDLAW